MAFGCCRVVGICCATFALTGRRKQEVAAGQIVHSIEGDVKQVLKADGFPFVPQSTGVVYNGKLFDLDSFKKEVKKDNPFAICEAGKRKQYYTLNGMKERGMSKLASAFSAVWGVKLSDGDGKYVPQDLHIVTKKKVSVGPRKHTCVFKVVGKPAEDSDGEPLAKAKKRPRKEMMERFVNM